MKMTESPSSSYTQAMTPASIELKAERVAATKEGTDVASAFVLAMLAGAFVGMGATFMLVVKCDGTLPYVATQLLGGFAFCLGLFLVLAAGAELFTGNCLMVMGPLSGRFSWGRLLRSWAVVYAGNLVGSVLLAALVLLADVASANGGALGEAAVAVATTKTSMGWWTIFFRGVLCNVLVCLAVWVGHSANSLTDKFFAALLPVMAFMGCGYEHCVANMFFLPYALMLQASGAVSGTVTLGGLLWNLSASTLGNVVGGAALVGCGYWLVYGRARAKEVDPS